MDLETLDDNSLRFYLALAVVVSRNRPAVEYTDKTSSVVQDYINEVVSKLDDPVWFWQKRYQEKCREMDAASVKIQALKQKLKEFQEVDGQEQLESNDLSQDVDLLVKSLVRNLQSGIDLNHSEYVYCFMETLRQWVRVEDLSVENVLELTRQLKQCHMHAISTCKDNGNWFRTTQSIVEQTIDLYYTYFCSVYRQLAREDSDAKEGRAKKKKIVKDAKFTLAYLGSDNIMVLYYTVETLCNFVISKCLASSKDQRDKISQEDGKQRAHNQLLDRAIFYKFLDKVVSVCLVRLVCFERSTDLFLREYADEQENAREQIMSGLELRKIGLQTIRSQMIEAILWNMDDLMLQAKFLDMKWTILN